MVSPVGLTGRGGGGGGREGEGGAGIGDGPTVNRLDEDESSVDTGMREGSELDQIFWIFLYVLEFPVGAMGETINETNCVCIRERENE